MSKLIKFIVTTFVISAALSWTSVFAGNDASNVNAPVRSPVSFHQACNADTKTYCSNVLPGDGRLAACLYAHSDLLDEGCYQATGQVGAILESVFDGIESLHAACQVDLRHFCAGVNYGNGEQLACLRKNVANISPGCNAALPGGR